jgi:hypothetical protein
MLECEEALEARFLEMMDEAHMAGWNVDETAVAITNLADNLILKLIAQAETMRQVIEAKQRRN